MNQSIKYLLIIITTISIFAGYSWLGSNGGLKEWRKLGKLVSLSQIKELPKQLQTQLELLKAYLNFPSQKAEFGNLQKSVKTMLKLNKEHNNFSLTSTGTANNGISHSQAVPDFTLKDIGRFTYVLFFDDDNDHTNDWVIEIAKMRWIPPTNEALKGKRYLYQIPSRMAYTIRMNKIIQEKGLTHVSAPDAYLVILNNEIEPTDDNSSFCSKWVKNDGITTFFKLGKLAQANDKPALNLISEMMQVIYFAGLWNIHPRDVLFLSEAKVAFVDHETPGLGGNPWLQEYDGKAPIKPWLALNKKGEQTLKGSGKYGVRQLWELLFNFPKDTLFQDKKRVKWFGKNIEHDILEKKDFAIATIKKKIDEFLEVSSR